VKEKFRFRSVKRYRSPFGGAPLGSPSDRFERAEDIVKRVTKTYDKPYYVSKGRADLEVVGSSENAPKQNSIKISIQKGAEKQVSIKCHSRSGKFIKESKFTKFG